jgi:hypothetical protein
VKKTRIPQLHPLRPFILRSMNTMEAMAKCRNSKRDILVKLNARRICRAVAVVMAERVGFEPTEPETRLT